MKKALSLILILVMSLSLCACGSSNNTADTEETNETANIEVKGLFYLDPAENLDLSEEGLSTAQNYLLLVYDVVNNSDKNIELSTSASSITLNMNNTNSYNQISPTFGDVLGAFIENCGYSVSTKYGTLWGGSEPVRMIASFAINKNDIKDDCTAEIDFQLADDIKDNITMTAEEIQTINLPDGVFAVEDDPDAYQIARTVKSRAELCIEYLQNAVKLENEGYTIARAAAHGLAAVMFAEEGVRMSCCSAESIVGSEDLPTFNIESVSKYLPELTDKIITARDNIDIMIAELNVENPDYDKVNEAQYTAYDALVEILDYFEAE
ncbi:MAG: hypothetical protein LUE88_03740 [Clostridiales bacterium]|nr:hypothetical protein [Clostridiales bacterium]